MITAWRADMRLLTAIALTLVFAAAGARAQDLESCYKVEGAQAHGLPEAYLRFLDSVKNAEWRSPKNDANPKNGRLRRSVAR